MGTRTDKLIFFDKEGYPYNLNYDSNKNEWNGKIYMDENSSDTFKTKCLYVFEEVDPFEFNDVFDINPSQLFNYSGMTFIPMTFTGETITNIEKVNSSSLFYSKWIYGNRFDEKFPVGTVVYFNNITGTTIDFNFHESGTTYYNVLGTKKDAFLITTYVNNKDFNFNFSGGTVSSINVIKVPDYGNQNLVDFNNLNYYKNKKISIQGSDKNDGVYTYNDYNILKSKIYDFLLPDITYDTGITLSIEFDLMTQRPELYEGYVDIQYNNSSITGTTIDFYNYINTNIDFVNTGQTIIFEKPDGSPIDQNDPEFIITGFVDMDYITKEPLKFYTNLGINTIETTSAITYNLKYNDYIEISAEPYLTGQTLHDKRNFQVLDVVNNKIQVREYIIPETGYTYTINKVINKKKIKKLYCYQTAVLPPDSFSGYVICHSTTNKINLNQTVLLSGTTAYFYENTISALKNKYKLLLDRYGLNIYHYNYNNNNYLMFEGIDYNFNPYYENVKSYIGSTQLNVSDNFTYLSGSTYQDSDVYYFSIMENLKSYEKIYHYDKFKLAKNFLIEIYFNIQRDSSGYGFNLLLNGVDYYIPISGISSTYSQDTINSFINKYKNIFDINGISIYSGYTNDKYTGYTLIIEGNQPNIILYDVDIKVNMFSSYSIINKTNNNSIVIDSSELFLNNINNSFYNYEMSTGMIINIDNSNYILNNKQFNVLRVTPDILQLSYQGPILYEYNKNLNISVNRFLRTPRGNYDKNVYYKLSWDPIEDNNPQISPDIFYYDYSGLQLLNTGELTYTGPKPLWNINDGNLVFLNNKPNTNLSMVKNPEYQQTIFNELIFPVEKLNSSINYNYVPVPIEIFIGFNSKFEGVVQNNLVLNKIENVIFSGTTNNTSGSTYIKNFIITSGETESYIDYITDENYFTFTNNSQGHYEDEYGNIYNYNIRSVGFEPGQNISLTFLERTITGSTIFKNYEVFKILDVTDKRIVVSGFLYPFNSSDSNKTYDFIIKTEPVRLAFINIYGQTEIEDDRFNQHLKLLGANVETEIQPIFKESDINEIGIDYTILNRKRKELLTVYPEIYNYIGSYKALINSINYFGYNDLDLYEYYRCIKPKSPLYGKLHRVLIENIFINTIPGWEEAEMDKKNYLKTNLFNLTYYITDIDGNYIEMYSLKEVQYKLTKMVQWLRKNIIPLSANILDRTGVANVNNTMYINYDPGHFVKKTTVNQNISAINFKYTQTLNIDTNYLFTIDFYLTSGSTMPDYWTSKIRTFHLNKETKELEPVQYIELLKTDLSSYSFNIDSNIDSYMYIETQSFNEYGLGYTNSKLFNYNEGRVFVLINNNFGDINYKYVSNQYGYYIIEDGRFYLIQY